jgi:hypothetical protein
MPTENLALSEYYPGEVGLIGYIMLERKESDVFPSLNEPAQGTGRMR